MSFIGFINSLFVSVCDTNKDGLFIQRVDGHITRIDIFPINDKKAIIKMDDIDMGYFEEMTARGYKASFYQKYRPHIKDGLFPNESLLKAICSHPLVLFYDA